MKIKSFRNEKRKQYYFKVFDGNGDQVLRSEAYNSKPARDNGIASFKTNAPISERYDSLTSSDGKFYFNVKAANHQIVATSLMFDSEEKRASVIAEIIAYASSAGSESSAPLPPPPPTEIQNLAATPKSTTEKSSSNTSSKKSDEKSKKSGKVLLLSQGYKAEAGRDNGIASVKKNAPIEKRYTNHDKDGKFFFTLKAGNHQEIARSTDFDSEGDRTKAIAVVMNGGGSMSDGKALDDYMNFDFYKDSGTGAKSGFDRFQKGDHDFHYFSFLTDDSRVILKSQGYKAPIIQLMMENIFSP